MRTYDLTPLFRTSVGFDRMSRLMESALQLEGAAKGYPPYNIVRKEQDQYRITLAVAGFADDELGIELILRAVRRLAVVMVDCSDEVVVAQLGEISWRRVLVQRPDRGQACAGGGFAIVLLRLLVPAREGGSARARRER